MKLPRVTFSSIRPKDFIVFTRNMMRNIAWQNPKEGVIQWFQNFLCTNWGLFFDHIITNFMTWLVRIWDGLTTKTVSKLVIEIVKNKSSSHSVEISEFFTLWLKVVDHCYFFSFYFLVSSADNKADLIPIFSSSSINSPDWCICNRISQPPINSPLKKTCGIVGQLE